MPDRINCINKICRDKERMVHDKDTGECITCKDYHIADEKKQNCVLPKCGNVREKITQDGKCELCENYHYPDRLRRKCVLPTCQGKREYISE